jgi:hypothetical protein
MSYSMYMDNFTKFSFVRDTVKLDNKIDKYLEQNGYGKCKPYFINKYSQNYKDSTFYPYVKLTDTLFVVNVSTIPGNTNQTSFSLLIRKTNKIEITDTLGPFYNKYAGAIKNSKQKGIFNRITLLIYDKVHGSVFEQKYIKQNGKFREKKQNH